MRSTSLHARGGMACRDPEGEEGIGPSGRASDQARVRPLLQSLRWRRGSEHPRDRGHRDPGEARRALRGCDLRMLRTDPGRDEGGVRDARDRDAGLRRGIDAGRRGAGRGDAPVPALREALQQLRQRRSQSSITGADAGGSSNPGEEDHVPSRRRPDRGVHRRDRVHGARGRESGRSRATDHLHPRPVRVSEGRGVQARRRQMGDLRGLEVLSREGPRARGATSRRMRPLLRRVEGGEFRPMRSSRHEGRHAVHAGDQRELRDLLSARRLWRRGHLPFPRSRRARGFHPATRRRGLRAACEEHARSG